MFMINWPCVFRALPLAHEPSHDRVSPFAALSIGNSSSEQKERLGANRKQRRERTNRGPSSLRLQLSIHRAAQHPRVSGSAQDYGQPGVSVVAFSKRSLEALEAADSHGLTVKPGELISTDDVITARVWQALVRRGERPGTTRSEPPV